jgi:hypothetical protein
MLYVDNLSKLCFFVSVNLTFNYIIFHFFFNYIYICYGISKYLMLCVAASFEGFLEPRTNVYTFIQKYTYFVSINKIVLIVNYKT